LYSLHVDIDSGDRKQSCQGKMAPIYKSEKADGEEVLVSKCEKCGFIRKNRVAGDDSYEVLAGLGAISFEELNILLKN
jgi:hypothetical protein